MALDKVTRSEEKKNTVELEITVPADEFEAAVEASYRKNVKKIEIPGFRKGKAPRKMIEKMYGKEVFYDDAINDVAQKAYVAAIEESKIEPVDRPEMEELSNDENGYKFKITVTVKPEVSVKEYKGIKVIKPAVTVTDADIENELKNYQQRQSRMIDLPDDAEAQNGDTAVFDFDGYVDGEQFEGGKAEKYSLKLGSGQFIPGFEDQMIGRKAGDEFSVNVTFPEDYQAENLKGKPAEFKCKIHALRRQELPEIDDELAKDVSEFDTLDELKEDIKKKVEERKTADADRTFDSNLDSAIADLCEAEIPQCMFDQETDDMVNRFANRIHGQGIDINMYLQYCGMTMEQLREMYSEGAVKTVKERLALEKIAEIEGIIIEDTEVEDEYKKLAEEVKQDIDKIRSKDLTDRIMKDLATAKAHEVVKNHAETVIEEAAAEKKEEAAE